MTGTEAEPVRVALMGLGGWGRQLTEKILTCPALELTVAVDPRHDVCAEVTATFGVRTSTDEAVLLEDTIEGVLIATPNTTHASLVSRYAAQGKHLFVEKPIAATVEEGRQMQATCAAAGVTLMVGHNTRRHGGHRLLKRLVEEDRLGTITMVEANLSHAGGMSLTGVEWRARRDECPAVGLLQLGVHHADTLQYLLGPVREVTALFGHVATPVDIDDVTLSLLRFQSGALGYLGSNYATPLRIHIALYGTQANAFCNLGGDVCLHWADGQTEVIPVPEVDTVAEELEEFACCIRTGKPPETDAHAGIAALAVIEAAILSAACGSSQYLQIFQ